MTDTTQIRRRNGLAEAVKAYAPILIVVLGGGGLGLHHAGQTENTDSMLEQHTEALRERVDYLEEWATKHNRMHMDER